MLSPRRFPISSTVSYRLYTVKLLQSTSRSSFPFRMSFSSSPVISIPPVPPTTRPTRPARQPRRFAPLSTAMSNTDSAPQLKGIIFDVDGTLCLPQNYMFGEMRAALGISKSIDILEHIRSLSDEVDDYDGVTTVGTTPTQGIPGGSEDTAGSEEPGNNRGTNATTTSQPTTLRTSPSASKPSSPRSRANHAIKQIETRAMALQTPQPGLTNLMTYLTQKQIRKALCTRNFAGPVEHLLQKFMPDQAFWPIITRETEGVEAKPSPEGLWFIARSWGKEGLELGDRGIMDDGSSGGDEEGWLSTDDDNSNYPAPANADTNSHTDTRVDATPKSTTKSNHLLPQATQFKTLCSNIIMVGDSIDDMTAGHHAGAATVLLVNKDNAHLAEHEYTDVCIDRLDDLVGILEQGFIGRR